MLKRILCVLLLLALLPCAFAEGLTLWCTEPCVSVMETPGSFDEVGRLCWAQPITVIGERDGWYEIRNKKGETGWVGVNCLTPEDPNTLNETRYTAVSGELLFDAFGPGMYRHRVKVDRNTPVTLIAVDDKGQYARVKYKDKYYYAIYPLLLESKDTEKYPVVMVVNDPEGTDLYAAPSLSAEIITHLDNQRFLWVIGGKDDALKVVTATDGKYTGWVHYDYRITQY